MGRNWDEAEDNILRLLVKTHGKQWNLIAQSLPKRTPSQVAARWEKCLDPNITKGPFTSEEDQMIADYVAHNGPRGWPRITSILPHRSSKQCRERWFNHLDPGVKKMPWTADEDSIIYQQHKTLGSKWSTIAKMLPGRTDNSIKNRWNSSISKRLSTDANGNEFILPDSSRRQYKQKNVNHERTQLEPIDPAEAIPMPPPNIIKTEKTPKKQNKTKHQKQNQANQLSFSPSKQNQQQQPQQLEQLEQSANQQQIEQLNNDQQIQQQQNLQQQQNDQKNIWDSSSTDLNTTPTTTPTNLPHPKMQPPPFLEIPQSSDLTSGLNSTITFTPFSLSTPFTADNGLFTPISPIPGFQSTPGAFGGLMSPSQTLGIFSPIKTNPNDGETFK